MGSASKLVTSVPVMTMTLDHRYGTRGTPSYIKYLSRSAQQVARGAPARASQAEILSSTLGTPPDGRAIPNRCAADDVRPVSEVSGLPADEIEPLSNIGDRYV